jgi:diguanylate cyclase (GGDEF)-like protein
MAVNHKNSPEHEQPISHFLSIFENLEEEGCFREELLPKHRRLVFRLCAFLAVAMPLFMLSDYMIVESGSMSFYLMIQRIMHISTCLLFLFFITRVRNYLTYDILVFSTLFIFLVLLEIGSLTYITGYRMYALFDIIIMISLYASGILVVKLSLILCVYHSVVAIAIVLFVKDFSVHDQIMMIFAYIFSNGAGILLAISQHKTARQEFFLKHTLQLKTLQLKHMAYRDSLTNALNRRAFQEHFRDFKRILQRAEGNNKSVFLIAADIDHFKAVNDSYGHDIGDKVLIAFTDLVESQIRAQDTIYRFGGEEFTILLQDCHVDIAIDRIEQIMNLLNNNRLDIDELEHAVTCSFGITPMLASDTVDSVCIRADQALYTAKNSGRNQYVFESA